MLLVDLGATPLETSISGNAVDHVVVVALAVALALVLALPHLALALAPTPALATTPTTTATPTCHLPPGTSHLPPPPPPAASHCRLPLSLPPAGSYDKQVTTTLLGAGGGNEAMSEVKCNPTGQCGAASGYLRVVK